MHDLNPTELKALKKILQSTKQKQGKKKHKNPCKSAHYDKNGTNVLGSYYHFFVFHHALNKPK